MSGKADALVPEVVTRGAGRAGVLRATTGAQRMGTHELDRDREAPLEDAPPVLRLLHTPAETGHHRVEDGPQHQRGGALSEGPGTGPVYVVITG